MKKYYKLIGELFSFRDILIESLIFSSAIILIDEFNLISKLFSNNTIIVIVLLFVCFLIGLLNKSNIKKVAAKEITELDKYLFVLLFVMIFLTIYLFLFNYAFYKLLIIICVSFIYLILIIIRIIRNKNVAINKNNTLDLQNICNKKIDLSDYNHMVLIEETDVSYDLLKRDKIIKQLYNVIVKTFPSKAFTVGLNGNWGSGKTTIVNNVLKRIKEENELKNYVVIKFDPWIYNDEKTMLQAFLNELLNQINFNISILNKKDIIQEVMSAVIASDKINMINNVLSKLKSFKKSPEISKVVNNYLYSNNKKLIIIIDNLDRIDGEKALFLIKCLDTVLNFNNTINVLLYDEEIINKVLVEKFNFNAKYMEKLVQLKIEVPIIDKFQINDIKNKVLENLVYSGEKVIEFVGEELYEFDNLRELKRYLNSIISLTIDTYNSLNVKDKSILKYIQLKCPELYYEIWNNKKYYISFDRRYDTELFTFDYERLNKEAREYFNNLYKKEEYKNYLKYVEKLFPNLEKSKHTNQDIFTTYTNESEYSDSVLNNHICNTRYFDLYYTNEENDFTMLRNDVSNIIKVINSTSEFLGDLELQVKKYNPDELKVFIDILYLSIDEIADEKCSELIKALIAILPYSKKRIMFGELDSNQRILIIIAKLLSKIDKNEFEKLKKLFNRSYKNLHLLSSIKYWTDSNKEKGILYKFDIDDIYNEMCSKIISKEVDIYKPQNYYKSNVWALYRYNEDQTREYLKNIVSKDNIYLILNDLISASAGTGGYGYSISDENLNTLIPEIDVNKYLKKKNLSDKEKFIKEVYEKSISEKDKFKKGVYLNEYIEL